MEAVWETPGPAQFGGLAHDDQGKWIGVFSGFLGEATILKAELWAVHKDMLFIKEKGWIGAVVEVDSTNDGPY